MDKLTRLNTDKNLTIHNSLRLGNKRKGHQPKVNKPSMILYNPKKKSKSKTRNKVQRKSFDTYTKKKKKKIQGVLMENYIQKLHTSHGKSKHDVNALRSMLNNCCHLMGTIPNPETVKSKMKQGSPQMRTTEFRSRRKYQVVEKVGLENKLKKETIQKKIQDHNRRYKRQRSSSLSRHSTQKVKQKFTLQLQGKKRNNSSMVSEKTRRTHERKERNKPGNLINSIKGMSKNFMNTFKRKSNSVSKIKKENSIKHTHYQCECNSNSTFKQLAWDSTSICKRLISVLKFKYSPNSAHINLKREFQTLMEEGELSDKIKGQIKKDVDRTYSDNEFLSSKISRQGIQAVLECVAIKYPEIGYVQGLNFIAATAYYHSDVYYSYGIFLTIFEILDMHDIFLPKLPGLTRHFSVIDTLILLKLKDVYSQFAKYKVTVEFFCTDWIMCLAMNVIPLEYSGILLSYLSEYGWNYFYRLIIYYLKFLEKRIVAQKDQADLLNLLKMLRNGKRKNGEQLKISWPKLLQDALYFSIDDELVNKLVGNTNYFKPCPTE